MLSRFHGVRSAFASRALSSALAFALLSVSVIVVVTGCKPRGYNVSSQTMAPADPIVLVHCMSTQGNGGNWSATLGWIAAEYAQLAARADATAASTGRRVLVYPRCFSGGSSGSGATNAVMSLLFNEKVLFSDPNPNPALRKAGFFSAADLRDYSKAMRFLGLSVDMNVTETLYFFSTLAQQTAVSVARSLGASAQANWWKSSLASAEGAVLDFGKVVHAASHLKASDLNQDISAIFDTKLNQRPMNSANERVVKLLNAITAARQETPLFERLKAFARAQGIATVSDFPKASALGDLKCTVDPAVCAKGRIQAALTLAQLFGNPQAVPLAEDALRYAHFYLIEAFQAFYAGSIVDDLASRDSQGRVVGVSPAANSVDALLRLKTRFNTEFRKAEALVSSEGTSKGSVPSGDLKSSLTESLAAPMGTGFLTITAAALSQEKANVRNEDRVYFNKPPLFDELRFMVFADRSTLESILKSPLYRKHIATCRGSISEKLSPPCRFVIAEVKHRVYSMLPSVREPQLMSEYYAPAFVAGAAGSEHLGIVRMFDPREVGSGSDLVSTVLDLSSSAGQARGASTHVAVAGGWPDRRLSAWMLMYHMDTLLSEDPVDGVKARYRIATQSSENPLLVASVSLFGKPDRVSDPQQLASRPNDAHLLDKFDVKQVSTVFSKGGNAEVPPIDSAVSLKNRTSYLAMLSRFYDFFDGQEGALDRGTVPVVLQESMNNWDLSEIRAVPAFVPAGLDGGATRFLVALSHNMVNEGLVALSKNASAAAGSDRLQYCSLSVFVKEPKGGVDVDRIQCVRRVASSKSGQAFRALGMATPEEEVRLLAGQATVTFNALDPRINMGRKDAVLVVRDSPGGQAAILSQDENPAPSSEQRRILMAE